MPRKSKTELFVEDLRKLLHKELSVTGVDTKNRLITVSCNGMAKYDGAGKDKKPCVIRYCGAHCTIKYDKRIATRSKDAEDTAEKVYKEYIRLVETDISQAKAMGLLEYATSELRNDFKVTIPDRRDSWHKPHAFASVEQSSERYDFRIDEDNAEVGVSGPARFDRDYKLEDPNMATAIRNDLVQHAKVIAMSNFINSISYKGDHESIARIVYPLISAMLLSLDSMGPAIRDVIKHLVHGNPSAAHDILYPVMDDLMNLPCMEGEGDRLRAILSKD